MRDSSLSQSTIQPRASIMSFLVSPLILSKSPHLFSDYIPSPLFHPGFSVVSVFVDHFSTQRHAFEPRSTEYSPCPAYSASPVLSTPDLSLVHPISITISPPRLAVTKKRVMPLPICSQATPSWIPLRCLNPALSRLSPPYRLRIKRQRGKTRVIVFPHLIPLVQRSTRLTSIAITIPCPPQFSRGRTTRMERCWIPQAQDMIGSVIKGSVRCVV